MKLLFVNLLSFPICLEKVIALLSLRSILLCPKHTIGFMHGSANSICAVVCRCVVPSGKCDVGKVVRVGGVFCVLHGFANALSMSSHHCFLFGIVHSAVYGCCNRTQYRPDAETFKLVLFLATPKQRLGQCLKIADVS